MSSPNQFNEILNRVAQSEKSGFELRLEAMNSLSRLENFDWSGIYLLVKDRLELDAFCGASTDHVNIEVGVGVCGTAISEDRNQRIDDVRAIENYLSCSASTRSEIVVLIRDDSGKVLGQIDVDGHRIAAFNEADEKFLEQLGAILAKRWG